MLAGIITAYIIVIAIWCPYQTLRLRSRVKELENWRK